MENSIIKIENLIYEYVKQEVLDDGSTVEKVKRALNGISLDIEKGSFLAVVGQNGSGKSTLAKNINGLLLPTRGKITVKGVELADDERIWDIRQNVAMVFQNPDNQLVASIVEDDVAFGPENLGVPSEVIRQRVDDALKLVGMYEMRNKAPHLLSGGQKQRIAIAGALAMDPDIIVFDEPTAMLDPKGRKEVMAIINKLHEEGKTIILITHFMEEAVQADRVVILKKGSGILLDGSPKEVFCQSETLRDVDLTPPLAVELGDRLRARGMDIPQDITRIEELVEYLCQLK
ncbi:MAG: energy-coupling factor transporter ATPase [Clostridia bacterium]|nr:energy-coupling factor transporter ATPase [Clostridia bacterium]